MRNRPWVGRLKAHREHGTRRDGGRRKASSNRATRHDRTKKRFRTPVHLCGCTPLAESPEPPPFLQSTMPDRSESVYGSTDSLETIGIGAAKAGPNALRHPPEGWPRPALSVIRFAYRPCGPARRPARRMDNDQGDRTVAQDQIIGRQGNPAPRRSEPPNSPAGRREPFPGTPGTRRR